MKFPRKILGYFCCCHISFSPLSNEAYGIYTILSMYCFKTRCQFILIAYILSAKFLLTYNKKVYHTAYKILLLSASCLKNLICMVL